MSYNPIVSYELNPPVSNTQEIQLANGQSVVLEQVISEMYSTEKEVKFAEWIAQNPNYDVKERREWLQDQVFINSWEQYAFQTSEGKGKINGHLLGLFMVKNCKLSTPTKCIHNSFGSSAQCVEKLTAILLGSIFNFREFLDSDICYDCLMIFCSKITYVEKLFDEYYKELTKWHSHTSSVHVVTRVKELYYLSHCLLKYQSFVNYVLNNDKLYTKIFSLFVYYMQNFNKLENNIANDTPMFSRNDQGYCIKIEGIHTLHTFEYNFNSILSCLRKLMCYFKAKHLCKLIEMNYFKYFLKFIDELFRMKYMKILTDAIIPGPELQIKGTCTLFAILSVVQFINHRVMNKLSINDIPDNKMRKKFQNLISQIKTTNKRICSKAKSWQFLSKIFKHGRYLRHDCKYPLMMCCMNDMKAWNMRTLLKKKSFQMRKHKRCGNSNCSAKLYSFKDFKVCSQCRIVYYCSRKCQKLHWLHHRLDCKLFI